MNSTRRDFVKISLAAGSGFFLPLGLGLKKAAAQVPGGTLNLSNIPKYMTRLFVPPAMPTSGPRYYEIAVRQFDQQILPAGLPQTTVWGYGSANHPSSFHYPTCSIEAPKMSARRSRSWRTSWAAARKTRYGSSAAPFVPMSANASTVAAATTTARATISPPVRRSRPRVV